MSCVHTARDDWQEYVVQEFTFIDFPPGGSILDIGCGEGVQLQKLQRQGCRGFGIDFDIGSVAQCGSLGLPVVRAVAEQIPFKSRVFDGAICKVVIPYTDEIWAIREIGRVLKDEAVCYCCYHGAGYYLWYLLVPFSWKFRFYGLRTLVNTWIYATAGVRLPGFLGDTLYQSRRRLAEQYCGSGLRLLREPPAKTFLGFPVFIYHAVQKLSR